MAAFYGGQARRACYQEMIDAEGNSQPLTEKALRAAVLMSNPSSVFEVGCGSGRLYRGLRADGFTGAFTGLDMSVELTSTNRAWHPEANWVTGSIYAAGVGAANFDVVFAYFVLEHCVYPGRALERMVQLLRPGGTAVLVFPDFVAMGRFASQALGFVDGRAGQVLRRGDVINAFVNLYDARARLPRALRRAVTEHGPFPVNLQPRCLAALDTFEPDADAVYIASKREVADWAETRRLRVKYPSGTQGHFRENALVALERLD
jgi:SAM-dependent methyltransferase